MTSAVEAYGIVISKDVMIPMRDGVRLAADIYRPAIDGEPSPGKFPAILGRTSYDKDNIWLWVEPVANYFTPRGYVVVIQDLRGRGNSEGTGQYFHTANPNEGPDGFDTVEWIAGQSWSNGRVGTTGSSHGSIVQQVMALHRPPHLSAMWPDVGPTNSYAHQAREGGAMQLHMFGAQFLHAQNAQEIRGNAVAQQLIWEAMEDLRQWVFRTPFKPGQTPLRVVPNLEKTLFDYYYRGAYDEFWAMEANDQERYWDRHADVPAIYSSGWFDPYVIAMTRYYEVMSHQNRTTQQLVVGPWYHGGMREMLTYAGDVDFGPQSVWGNDYYNQRRLRWFDCWLRDLPTGVEADAPVLIFVMGGGDGRKLPNGKLNHGGSWRAEAEWPIARAQPTPYYLRAGGGLTRERPVDGEPPTRFTFNPDRPVPTIGGPVTGFFEAVPVGTAVEPHFAQYVPWRIRMRSIITAGPMHQQEAPDIVGAMPPYSTLAARSDVLVFQTPPLDQDIEVTGLITVRLWISSSAVDTDFTAKLLDISPPNADYPEGFHLNLCDSIIRARYRESWEREVLMEPGQVYPVTITLPPTSNLFKAGHRIRLDVSSSNFPRFDLNPNTGEPIGRHTRTEGAHNSVYMDSTRPSHIVLPIIPRQS